MLGTPEGHKPSDALSISARPRLRPRYWAQAQAENPLARFIPFSSLISAHDVITRGGDYLRVWRLDGVAFECADEHQVAERHEALCSLLRNLAGGQWAVWTHRVHRIVRDTLLHPRAHGFARDLSLAYQAKLGERVGAAMLLSLIDDSVKLIIQNQSHERQADTLVLPSTTSNTSKLAEKVLDSTINIPPLIYQNQGGLVGIYVARDVDFSSVYELKPLETEQRP